MARTKSGVRVGIAEEIRNNVRRSPRLLKHNDVPVSREIFKSPNLKSASVSGRSTRIGKLRDSKSVPDPKTPNLEYVRNQVRRSSRDKSLLSPLSCGNVMVKEGADEVRHNKEVKKSLVFALRRSPRFPKYCREQIVNPKPGASEKKPDAKVKRMQENRRNESVCLRRSPRFSNQQRNYAEVDEKLDEICGNDGGKSEQRGRKNLRKSNNPMGFGEESLKEKEEASWKNEEKPTEAGKKKRKRAKEGIEVVRGWTEEQEMALQRAYMAMKPTPGFWKKVSKMVGKSAQECFDRINYDAHTPVPPRIRSRLNKEKSPPVSGCCLSASKLLVSPPQKRTRKRKTQLGQKKVRELLQRQCNIEKDYEGDLFSILEGNIASSPLRVFQQAPAAPTPLTVPLRNGSNSFSARKKCASRLGKAALLVSPLVLKQVKNKVLHEKYIDQLHTREAKRKAELTRAKKTTFGKENLAPSCNQKSNVVKAAKDALVSDARDVILQFQQVQAKALNNSPSDSENDILLSSDEIEDEL